MAIAEFTGVPNVSGVPNHRRTGSETEQPNLGRYTASGQVVLPGLASARVLRCDSPRLRLSMANEDKGVDEE